MALFEQLFRTPYFQPGYLKVQPRLAKLFFRDSCFSKSLFCRRLRGKTLGHELTSTILFASQEFKASLSRFDGILISCLGLSQCEGGLFNPVFELAQDLALADHITSVDVQPGNDPDDRTGELHHLLRLNHAIERRAFWMFISLRAYREDAAPKNEGDAAADQAAPNEIQGLSLIHI